MVADSKTICDASALAGTGANWLVCRQSVILPLDRARHRHKGEMGVIRTNGSKCRSFSAIPYPRPGTDFVRNPDGYDRFFRSRKWNPERSRPLHPHLPSSLTKIEEAILRMLPRAPDRRLPKRTLQQRLWRLPAKFLNHMIQSVATSGDLQWQGAYIWVSGPSRQL